jgi:hypothetical protein
MQDMVERLIYKQTSHNKLHVLRTDCITASQPEQMTYGGGHWKGPNIDIKLETLLTDIDRANATVTQRRGSHVGFEGGVEHPSVSMEATAKGATWVQTTRI